MITNFQLPPRSCKTHHLPQHFICLHPDCHYTPLLCPQCTRQAHSDHLHELRSIDSFTQSFRHKVQFYQQQFETQKVVINVKQIVRAKLNQLDQAMNDLLINLVKIIEKQKDLIKHKLNELQQKYQTLETEYRKNLQARFDCLHYLSAYKNSPQVLQARLLCSSDWGIVSLKNALLEIKNLSTNQARDVDFITDSIMQEGDRILKQDNFLWRLIHSISEHKAHQQKSQPQLQPASQLHIPAHPQPPIPARNTRIKSFIQKSSLISTNAHPSLMPGGQSSRVIEQQRPRTFSLSNLYRPASNQYIPAKQTSMERIPLKVSAENSLDNLRYIRGLKKNKLESVVIF